MGRLGKRNKKLLRPFTDELEEVPSDICYVSPVWQDRNLSAGLIYSLDRRLNVIIGKKTYFLNSNSVGISERPMKIPHEPSLLDEKGQREKSKNISLLALLYPQVRKGNYQKNLLKELYRIKDLLFLVFDYLNTSDLMTLLHSDPFLFRKLHGPENDIYWIQRWSELSSVKKSPEEIQKILIQSSCDFENSNEFRKREELNYEQNTIAILIKIKYGMDRKLDLKEQSINANMVKLAIKYEQLKILEIILPSFDGSYLTINIFRIDATPEILGLLLDYIEQKYPNESEMVDDIFETATIYGNFESMSYLLKRSRWNVEESPDIDEKERPILKAALMYIQIGDKMGFLQYFDQNVKIFLRKDHRVYPFKLEIFGGTVSIGNLFRFYLRIATRDKYKTILKYFNQYLKGKVDEFSGVLFNYNLTLVEYLLQHDLKVSVNTWADLNKKMKPILSRNGYSLLAKYYGELSQGVRFGSLYDKKTRIFKRDEEIDLKKLDLDLQMQSYK